MAQSGREIKRRIASITSTQQITRAMEMIAATKLRQAQEQVFSTRPYFQRLKTSLSAVLSAAEKGGEDLAENVRPRRGPRYCLLVITSDRGLAGGYNVRILRQAEIFLKENPATDMVIVGRKARDYFRSRNQTFLAEFVNLGDDTTLRQGQQIGQVIYDFYLHGLFDRISILSAKFINSITHPVELRTVLPLAERQKERPEESGLEPLFLYEPSINAVLAAILPLYINAAVFQSLVEAKASEFGARMTAMRSATDNAGELIEELNLTYHRARQAVITKEIAEIVGGADALKA